MRSDISVVLSDSAGVQLCIYTHNMLIIVADWTPYGLKVSLGRCTETSETPPELKNTSKLLTYIMIHITHYPWCRPI